MALVILSPDQKPRSTSFRTTNNNKPPPPSRLKDYLLDDLSSCSSSGFRNFPRRGQCCAAAAALVLHNSITRSSNHTDISSSSKRFIEKNKKKSPSKLLTSVLQRASVAVINAVKLIPLIKQTTTRTATPSSKRRSILPKSLSRSLFGKKSMTSNNTTTTTTTTTESLYSSGRGDGKRSNNRNEIERWIKEDSYVPSDLSNTTMTVTTTTSSASTTSVNSDRWSESDDHCEFTRSFENGVVSGIRGGKTDGRKSFSVTVAGEESVETAATTKHKNWIKQLELEEKEQLSPVSVLNFPVKDYDHEQTPASPSPHRRLKTLNGTRKRLMRKLMRFDRLSNLDSVNLESSLHLHLSIVQPTDRHTRANPTTTGTLPSLTCRSRFIIKPEEAQKRAELIRIFNFEQRRLLRESELEGDGGWLSAARLQRDHYLSKKWNKKAPEQDGIIIIDQEGCWHRSSHHEKEEVVLALEVQLLGSLINELLADMVAGLV